MTRDRASPWIRLSADYRLDIDADPALVASILWDFEGLNRVFSRLGAVRVSARGGGWVDTEQSAGAGLFGLSFSGSYGLHYSLDEGPSGRRIEFTQPRPGDTIAATHGIWQILDLGAAARPRTRVLYHIEFEALARFPAQEEIMRNFGPGDIEKTLRELAEAAAAR